MRFINKVTFLKVRPGLWLSTWTHLRQGLWVWPWLLGWSNQSSWNSPSALSWCENIQWFFCVLFSFLVCSNLMAIFQVKMAVKCQPNSGLLWPQEADCRPRRTLFSGIFFGFSLLPNHGNYEYLPSFGPFPFLRSAREVSINLPWSWESNHIKTTLSYALSGQRLRKPQAIVWYFPITAVTK